MKTRIQLLSKSHSKENFNCGKDLLNNYIKKQASQDIKRGLAACYILHEEDNEVKGYYTLSSNSIDRDVFPPTMASKLPPSYINLPTILLGRLAVDLKYQGKGLGGIILLHALNKCVELSKDLGLIAVIVDPLDDDAITFYKGYGFELLPGTNKMFITIKTIEHTY